MCYGNKIDLDLTGQKLCYSKLSQLHQDNVFAEGWFSDLKQGFACFHVHIHVQ